MSRHTTALARAAGLCLLAVSAALPAATEANREWHFDVSLDGRPIGYHRFELRENRAGRELVSEARFRVRVLFFDAYSYAHDATELWHGNCLDRIDARTNDNGDERSVRGTRGDTAFLLTAPAQERALPRCVQTFAYWNPSILNASRLLNPQTGEYVPVRVVSLGSEPLDKGGGAARRYRLIGSGEDAQLQIDLWYGEDGEWLALESLTDDGRRLRYQVK